MKIKEGFVLRDVAGETVVIAVGEASKSFQGMIGLNQTGRDIWQGVSEGLTEAEIAARLAEQYKISPEKAREDTGKLLGQMREAGMLDD